MSAVRRTVQRPRRLSRAPTELWIGRAGDYSRFAEITKRQIDLARSHGEPRASGRVSSCLVIIFALLQIMTSEPAMSLRSH
jgi:hypothetical protein